MLILYKEDKENFIINNTIIYNNNTSKNPESENIDLSLGINKDLINWNDIFKNAINNFNNLYKLIWEKYKNDFLEQIPKYNVIGTNILGKEHLEYAVLA